MNILTLDFQTLFRRHERRMYLEPEENKYNDKLKKIDKNKKTILLLNEDRIRSPLSTQFYNRLEERNNFNVLQAKCGYELNFNECNADFVHVGLGYINNNIVAEINSIDKIPKIILEIGDINTFVGYKGADNYCEILKYLKIDILLFRMNYKLEVIEKLKKFISKNKCLQKTKLLYLPWGIDKRKYYSCSKKDIDVSMIMSIDKNWKFHDTRVKIADKIKQIKHIDYYIENIYGKEYIDKMARSKIFIVDTSERRWVTQKYLEASMCECMLLGEIPLYEDSIFVNKESIVELNLKHFKDDIEYYLKKDKLRTKIASKCKENILKYNDIDIICDRYEKFLSEKL